MLKYVKIHNICEELLLTVIYIHGIIKQKDDRADYMYGRYKFTNFLAKYIDDLRTGILGYSHEQFGVDVLDNSQSTSYYLCTASRRNQIHIDVLRKIFLIEYNAYLFVQKQEMMSKLLSEAIASGDVLEKFIPKKKEEETEDEAPENKENYGIDSKKKRKSTQPPKPKKTTLKNIYRTNNNLHSSFNKSQICIPITIFTLGKCIIEPDMVNGEGKAEVERKKFANSIFDEKKFDEHLRYVPIEYASLTDREKIRVDDYISRKINVIFHKILDAKYTQYPIELIYEEYWLYGMYLMHHTVDIPKGMQNYINKLYWNDENKTDWNGIFLQLRTNESIKSIYKYETEDFVYFKDENRLISKHDFPLFVYKYVPIDFGKKDSFYQEECKRATYPDWLGNRKIKLIHLFMTIYIYFIRNGESENEAFEHTGQKFVAYGVSSLPFNKPILELYPLPQNPTIDISSENTMKFHKILCDFFDNTALDEKADADIIEFSKNFRNLSMPEQPFIFMKTIAFDFEILKELNNALAVELREELHSTVKKFKIKNKL